MDDARVLLLAGDTAQALACREAMAAAPVPLLGEVSCGSTASLVRGERVDTGYDVAAIDLQGEAEATSLLARAAPALAGAPIVAVVGDRQDVKAGELLRAGAAEVIPATQGYERHLASVLRLLAARHRLEREVEAQRRQMLELTTRDELTGLAKRRLFNETLESEIGRATKQHRPLSLVLINLDGLRLLNDTHGYSAGDAALRHVAGALAADARRNDLAARLGDDEFALLLCDTNFDHARRVADRLRERVAATPVAGAGVVTISAGVASVPAHAGDAAEIMRMANQALYDAKRTGRDRVAVSRDLRRERVDPRHPVRLKLIVSGRNSRGELFVEEAETEAISRRGANLVSAHTVTAGQQIEVRTSVHPHPLTAQITSCYQKAEGLWHVGFRLVKPPSWTVEE
jgi:diguanylate cyclase (GGDEF)-like protein